MSQSASGSVQMDVKKYISTLVSALKTGKKTENVTPYQIISGSGDAFYMAPMDKSFVRVTRGSEILVLPMDPQKDGRYHVVDSRGRYFLVPEEEILDIGYN